MEITSGFQAKLIGLLQKIPALEDEGNRRSLLKNIPQSLEGNISSTGARNANIRAIVTNLAESTLVVVEENEQKGKHCLRIVIENALSLVEGTKLGEDLKKLEQELIQELIQELDRGTLDGGNSKNFLFVNRLSEIDAIASPAAYYLVDAPAGYGKTWLLTELRSRFESYNWQCAYVAINRLTSIDDISRHLAAGLGVDFKEGRSPGESLAKAIIAMNKKYIVLLLDFEEEPNIEIFAKVVSEFIHNLRSTLSGMEVFVRIVIAGRYLTVTDKYKEIEIEDRFRFTVIALAPFDYSAVLDFAKEKIGNTPALKEIAAHLLYWTGGHPKSVSAICQAYKSKSWTCKNLEKLRDPELEDWKELEATILKIHDSFVPQEWRDFITKLSVFRYLDSYMMEKLLEKEGFTQARLVLNRLTENHVLTRPKKDSLELLKNERFRRMLVLWLKRCALQDYKAWINEAKSLYIECLDHPGELGREIWVAEYLFQCLQGSDAIEDTEKRKELPQTFWDDVRLVMCKYLSQVREHAMVSLKDQLIERIKADEEFRFAINYYLRVSEYNEEPCQKLYSFINSFDPTRSVPDSLED